MAKYDKRDVEKSPRIQRLVDALYKNMPVIEGARARLLTESYKATEGEPLTLRRAKAFDHILRNLPIVIRDEELVVGSTTVAPRGCQTYPEFSYEWLEAEFDTVATRAADPFTITEETKREIREADKYWKGKTSSELAYAYMSEDAKNGIAHNIFTPGNYFYNGVGHITVKYGEILESGFDGVKKKIAAERAKMHEGDGDYCKKSALLTAMEISANAVIAYANRYAALAEDMAKTATGTRREELLQIAKNCRRVPDFGATGFYEACQSF